MKILVAAKLVWLAEKNQPNEFGGYDYSTSFKSILQIGQLPGLS